MVQQLYCSFSIQYSYWCNLWKHFQDGDIQDGSSPELYSGTDESGTEDGEASDEDEDEDGDEDDGSDHDSQFDPDAESEEDLEDASRTASESSGDEEDLYDNKVCTLMPLSSCITCIHWMVEHKTIESWNLTPGTFQQICEWRLTTSHKLQADFVEPLWEDLARF